MSWQRAVRSSDLSADGDEPAMVTLGGKTIGVFRTGVGVTAVLDYCPHAGAPVCRGRVEGFTVITRPGEPLQYDSSRPVLICPWHHFEFFLESGQPVMPIKKRLKLYPAEERAGWIYIDL